MSLRVMTQGGGTGGASASIFATGLSEADTVTAVKDGKTVQGKWVERKNPAYVVPDGYTQLEYIESTGTQYIDTGIYPTSGDEFEIDFTFASIPTTAQTIFGVSNNVNENPVIAFDVYPAPDIRFGTAGGWYAVGSITAKKTHAALSGTTLTIGESSFAVHAITTTSNYSLKLGVWHGNTGIATFSLFQTHAFKWKRNGAVIVNYTPAKRNSDGAIGMYDIVTSVFYANAGTGEFIAGPEVPQYIYGYDITPIKNYGMWTVTATNGENTTTQDVLVDAAVEYEISMMYEFYTEFDEKDADWVEEGGTFNYGDGLYQVLHADKGTISVGANDVAKYLTIPIATAETFNLEMSCVVETRDRPDIGLVDVVVLDANENEMAKISQGDAWGGDYQQTCECFLNGIQILFTQGDSSYNGVTVVLKLVYDGTNIYFYRDDTELYSTAINLNPVEKIRIDFRSNKNSSYNTPAIKVHYLRLV